MIERAFFGGAGPNGFTTQLSPIISGKEKQFAINHSMMDAIARASREMLEDAKRTHDEVERCYTCAMDFDALDSICERICEEIDCRKMGQQ